MKDHIKYPEGQWFAIPLLTDGYAIGIIVRGAYKTKGGIGYFFGPKYNKLPTGSDTFSKSKDNPICIAHFGDLGIINGEWPLIKDGKPFDRVDWPVPIFHRIVPFKEDQILLVDYGQDYSGRGLSIHDNFVPRSEELLKLPKDGVFGYLGLQIKLTNLLKEE